MHSTIHRGDGCEVDYLHITVEMRVAYYLPCRARVHAQDPAMTQVQHVAPIQLRTSKHAMTVTSPRGG